MSGHELWKLQLFWETGRKEGEDRSWHRKRNAVDISEEVFIFTKQHHFITQFFFFFHIFCSQL